MKYELNKFNRIRDLRADKDLSQREVSKVLGVAPNTLSHYETGTLSISNDIMRKLSQFYNVSIDYLLGLTDQKDTYSLTDKTIYDTSSLKKLRKDKNLFQKETCAIFNIAQNTLSQYETGVSNIPNETLIKMAIFYNTSVDYLLGLTDDQAPHKREGESYLNLLKRYM